MQPKRFIQWMTDYDLNLKTAGEALGLHEGSISRYRNGVIPIPTMAELAIETLERRWQAQGRRRQAFDAARSCLS